MNSRALQRAALEQLYAEKNNRVYVHPDPLEVLYAFPALRDREIVGFIAAALAFGGVKQILASIRVVLERLENQPYAMLADTKRRGTLQRRFADFRYRWVDGTQMADTLWALRETIRCHGSLEAAMQGATTSPLITWVDRVRACGRIPHGPLLSDPRAGSACKRMHLYLRWMVRCDAVDPGGWAAIAPARLHIPLDRHMHRIALEMNLTRRKQADGKTVEEVTEGFRRLCPHDPVRYDFVLTRFGIRRDGDRATFLHRYGSGPAD